MVTPNKSEMSHHTEPIESESDIVSISIGKSLHRIEEESKDHETESSHYTITETTSQLASLNIMVTISNSLTKGDQIDRGIRRILSTIIHNSSVELSNEYIQSINIE